MNLNVRTADIYLKSFSNQEKILLIRLALNVRARGQRKFFLPQLEFHSPLPVLVV